jgi:hypothetical protein
LIADSSPPDDASDPSSDISRDGKNLGILSGEVAIDAGVVYRTGD